MHEILLIIAITLTGDADGAFSTAISEPDVKTCVYDAAMTLKEIVPQMDKLGYSTVSATCSVGNGDPA